MPRSVYRPLDLDAFPHVADERLRSLLRHWLDRRGGAPVPPRSAIDAAGLRPILARVWICDFLPQERRFRMRLAGEEINRTYGRNITHCYFEDIITPALLDDVMRRYLRVVEEPAILHCSGHIYLASDRSHMGDRLVLPLADDDGAVVHVIGASILQTNPAVAEGPILRESMAETFTPMRG